MATRIFNAFKDGLLIVGITVFLIFIGHYAIGGARFVKHSIKGIKTGQAHLEETRLSPVFSGYEGYDDFYQDLKAGVKESKMHVQPYYHWRRGPFTGSVMQIDEQGIRRTIKDPSINPDAKKVFMFGGSTMWGTGSPNQYTIPSQLQALLGPKFDVYNFGETAFVSTQQLNLLLEQLSKGFIPDVVIFYDGVNDTYASMYSPGIVRHPQFKPEDYTSKEDLSYLLLKLVEKTNYIAITERIKMALKKDQSSLWEKNIEPNLDAKSVEMAKQYAELIKQTKALGKEYGFAVYHFWQPMLVTENRKLTEYEQEIYNGMSAALVKSYKISYATIKKNLSSNENFYNLVDIFKETNEPIYFDFCHMGPKGNKIVAENMYKIAFK